MLKWLHLCGKPCNSGMLKKRRKNLSKKNIFKFNCQDKYLEQWKLLRMRFASAWKIQHAKNICNMKVKQPERSQSLRGGRPEIKKKQKKTFKWFMANNSMAIWNGKTTNERSSNLSSYRHYILYQWEIPSIA